MDDLLSEFLTESSESYSVLDAEIVKLEQNPNDQRRLGEIFRILHTVKGNCRFLEFRRLEALAHGGETVLEALRRDRLPATPDAISLLLACVDRSRELLAEIRRGGREPAGDDCDLLARLDGLLARPKSPPGGAAPRADGGRPAEQAAVDPGQPAATERSVRVGLDLLDALTATVSEVALARDQCLQAAQGRMETSLAAPLQRLDEAVSELLSLAMRTRMQPIGEAWARLPRLVRDLSQGLGKKIKLVLSGGETEVDRRTIDLVRDSLVHIVTNAADHGLEPAQERLGQGKAETGTIEVRARAEGRHAVIEVVDDGRGLAVERIRQRAAELGIVGCAELASMSDHRIIQFILEPGFSTADRVSPVSGRGIGMDVVRANLERAGGTLRLSSVPGEGTRFVLEVPLSVTVLPALVVACRGRRFALPQRWVVEVVPRGPKALSGADRDLPLVELAAALGLNEAGEAEGARDATPCVVVTRAEGEAFALLVDRVVDTEDLVVKAVAPILRDVTLFSGTATGADGQLVTVLDPNGIAASDRAVDGDPAWAERASAGGAGRRRVLLVGATPFFRNLLGPLLIDAGYDVTLAEGAAAALDLCVAGHDYDAIISDVEAPGTDGLSFAQAVRAQARWRRTPLVALSSRDAAPDPDGQGPTGFDRFLSKADHAAVLRTLRGTVTGTRGAS